MPELFNDRYRIRTTRMRHWNYAWKGHYFVTIKTKDGIPYFGEIRNAEIRLNAVGKILEREWLATPTLRPDMNIQLGEFVIMPNHFHGIISIGRNQFNGFDVTGIDVGDAGDVGDIGHAIETHCNASLQPSQPSKHPGPMPQNQFGPQSKNLAAIIRGLKGAITKKARQIDPDFGWQARFYDRLIRDQDA